jgi:transposase-like protein
MKSKLADSINSQDLVKTSQKYQDLSKIEIRKRIINRSGRKFSLDQKILILKLLQYNGMNYSHTSQEVGIRRETLYLWVKSLGELVFSTGPEYRIAQNIETSIAELQAATMKIALQSTHDSIIKLKELIGKTSTVHDIYPICEGLRALVQVMQVLLPEIRKYEQTKNIDWYVHKL